MASDQHCSPINTLELKALIYQKIGHQKADIYFDHLQRYFSYKISKTEFSKLCVSTIGREHIHLHNRLLQSLAKNAVLSKRHPRNVVRLEGSLNHRFRKGSAASTKNSGKSRDRPSPLGPFAKTPTSTTTISRPVLEEDYGEEVEQITEVDQITEVEQITEVAPPITAPIGICWKPLPKKSTQLKICGNQRELPDTKSLMIGLEKLVGEAGLGISNDSAKMLNQGLNAYLKRLIEPYVRISSSKRNRKNDGHMRQPFPCPMFDFLSSVKIDPQRLGENWPSKLEKTLCRAMPEN